LAQSYAVEAQKNAELARVKWFFLMPKKMVMRNWPTNTLKYRHYQSPLISYFFCFLLPKNLFIWQFKLARIDHTVVNALIVLLLKKEPLTLFSFA